MPLTYVNTSMIEPPVQFDTLSAQNLTGDFFTSTSSVINKLQVTSLTATNSLLTNLTSQNFTTDYYVQKVNTNITFNQNDNSKAFHFDTSVGPLTASFSKSLPIGFNVSLYNVGNFSITLSSNGVINTPGNSKINETRYTGMFIYKAPDPTGTPSEGVFYGVGVFQ